LPEWPRTELERYIDTLFESGQKFLGKHFMVRFDNKIKKIESQIAEIETRLTALDRKVKAYKGENLWVDLRVDSPFIPEGSGWTNPVDRILLCGVYCYGYGAWGTVRQLVRTFPQTCHNWVVHAKPVEEVKARVDELLEIVQEEFPPPKKSSSKKRKQ
jgi:hypothetical protein